MWFWLVLAALLFAKASVGSESSTVLSEQHQDAVQLLDEAYEGQLPEAQLARLSVFERWWCWAEWRESGGSSSQETAASAGSPEAKHSLA